MVGQLAKFQGCRVVGVAGGPQKCRAVTEEFGFDLSLSSFADGGWYWFDVIAGPVEAVLERFPELVLVIAHLGMGEYDAFADLAESGTTRHDVGLFRASRFRGAPPA